jgi:hypothetical protein
MRGCVLGALLLISCKSEVPCTITAEPLDFGEVEVGDFEDRRLVVLNSSDVDREVTAVPLAFPFNVRPFETLKLQAHSEEPWVVRFAPDDGLLHLDELVLEGGGQCDFSLPLRGLGGGTITVNPEKLEFTLGANQRVAKEVLIRNSRRTPTTVTLSWSILSGPATALSQGTPAAIEIPAGGVIPVPIIATPPSWDPVRAILSINGGPKRLEVSVTISPSSPRLEVTPRMIDVPQIGFDLISQPRGFAERTFRLRNVGTSGDPNAPRLQLVSSIGVFGNPDEVEVSWPPLPSGLAEGESTELTVRMTPLSLGQKTYAVSLKTEPLAFEQVQINTRANALPACAVESQPADVLQLADMGDGGLEGVVTFVNTSSEFCVVDNPRFSLGTPEGFAMIEGAFSQGEIAPGNDHHVRIAGPKSADAGTIGKFGFHVFSPNSDVHWIELRSP